MRESNFKLNRPNKKNNRTKLLAVILVVVLVFAGFSYYLYRQDRNEQRLLEEKAQDEAQIESSKSRIANDTGSKNGGDSESSNKTTDQVPNADNVTVSVTEFSQSEGVVRAAATASGTAAGSCVFTFTTADSKPVVSGQIASTSNGSNQTCSYTASEVEFNKLGTWNLNIVFYVNGSKVEANRDVTIN